MLTIERHERLLAYLAEHKSIRVSEASKQLNVTEKTIRLDLEALEAKHFLKRVHGGAVLLETETSLYPIQKRQQSHGEKKREIALKAKICLADHDVILLDGGSTTVAFAETLGDQPLTVITNDIQVGAVLYQKEKIQLIMLGGVRQGTSSALYSKETMNMLDSFYVKKAFIGTTGISVKNGLSVLNQQHIEWKKKIITAGEEVILLADSTKFGQTGLMTFADVNALDRIVTDTQIDESIKAALIKQGIQVY
ncbi:MULTISPECIES: DeoR/GlpR family DNA-binding transcription regulator [Shouchella]|uniref:DeoR/GlpR family DNA-binding transcription regulator n=2 Tax=Shouchella TaxID=2893057 RepID=A0ABY7W8B2_9BACI|nr:MULTISPECIES: DeoR/GlpR family DNA-binding transcription regulator [Shouchella]MED4128457.1 DeoR/GlpR family DNA-binding transcription regulator [Shouchella miscanthi]WDF04938.1 DeoR/GlpR family DNA-binding transcription regulator [Shouchella hunanensis]